ncbi:PIN domain-containing protein [Amycolatopsis umgeniensis]|uniref:PIN domain-containing protein n=1 Tax=Amycolatopsis umgeniensis TaxID=336628 RepID=A0A841B4A3_9PSEU|nr:hypothetical protein [Amycolatopsis umgeniensis]
MVLLDANVLYPNALRDLLIRIAQSGLVRAKWTDEILDEVFRNLKENRPDLDPGKLDRTRELMNCSVRDCLATGYEPLVPALTLPDPDDRHVLAAAIKAQGSDDFVLDRIALNRRLVVEAVLRIAASRRSPPTSFAEILDALERAGLRKSVAELRSWRADQG